MTAIYLTKTLIAASSNGIGSVSTAVPSVVTLNTSALDTGRRIVFYSTADASTLSLTFTGIGEQRRASFSETVAGSTASGIAATTTSDFSQLSAVSISSNANIPILIGTSSVGGTPWQSVNTLIAPITVGVQLHFSTSANGMTVTTDLTLDDPFAPSVAVPGGIVPSPNSPPIAIGSTGFIALSTDTIRIINTYGGGGGGGIIPIAAWRGTLTSSSSTAGSITISAIQSGVG